MSFEEVSAVVFDNGSWCIKAGFAGEDEPKSIFSSVVGKVKPEVLRGLVGMNRKEDYVGEEAQSKRGIPTSLDRPIQKGIVTDFDQMEKIWHHAFNSELRVSSEEHPILLTECPLNPKENREKTAQIFFERFNSPSIHISMTCALSMLAAGKTDGLSIDSGYESTHFVAIYNGQPIHDSIVKLDLGGKDVSNYLSVLLDESGYTIPNRKEDIVNEIKENLCYVPENLHLEMPNVSNEEYELPDGQVIEVGNIRVRATEILFDPSLVGLESEGIHHLASKSISKSGRYELCQNLVVSGGNTMFQGFKDRLYKEINQIMMNDYKKNTLALQQHGVWIGGSILASLSTFQGMSITKEEYENVGPSIVHKNQSMTGQE